jgi:hypothetical protein
MRSMKPLVLIGLFVTVCAQISVTCDFRNRNGRCYILLPYCRTYDMTPDSQNEGKFHFTCRECEAGFDPRPEGVRNLDLYPGETLPKSDELIELCQRRETQEPLYCSHPFCQQELHECLKYTVTNIVKREVDGKTEEIGLYKCLQCSPLFAPVDPQEASIDHNLRKYVCGRTMETRECGGRCQSEFPGCLLYTAWNKQLKPHDNVIDEVASFKCNQAEPGYQPNQRLISGGTNPLEVKEIALREYESPAIECTDFKCRHVFPNCKKYFSITQDEEHNQYQCIECRFGYEPARFPQQGRDFHLLYANEESLELCSLLPNQAIEADTEWREEMPGCKKLTTKPTGFSSDGIQYAQYYCDECDEGLESLPDYEPVPVYSEYDLASNVKIRCRPKPVTQPKACDAKCRDRLKNCQEYTTTYHDYMPSFVESFVCTTCDIGFTPTHDADNQPWFLQNEKHVCKRLPTDGPEECKDGCQMNFPYCESVSVGVDPEGHNTYLCHKCSDGFFPISYEDGTRGKLTKLDNPMRNGNVIYLCAPDPDELFLNYSNCDESDESIFDSKPCRDTVNCEVVTKVLNLLTGQSYYRCLECPQGYVARLDPPHPYDLDHRYCIKPAPPSSVSVANS